MRVDLVEFLCCPLCDEPVYLTSIATRFELDGCEHVVDGVLTCTEQHRFPVLDEVPRLLDRSFWSEQEIAAVSDFADGSSRTVEPETIDEPTAIGLIRETLARQYGIGPGSNERSRARARSHADYLVAEYLGHNKRKYARILSRVGTRPETILDVGGSLPGLIRCLADEFQPSTAVLADLAIQHARVFKTADRRIGLVRADAQRLPFRRASFDLVVSAFLLEHVPDWKSALRSISATGREIFVAYGPNRWFPFEIGHLNAPLANTLPRRFGKYAAYAWLNATGQRRSLAWIDDFLSRMTYISSRAFRSECRGLGLASENLFVPMVEQVIGDTAAPPSGLRSLARSWPALSRVGARALVSLGMEPQVYYYLARP